MSVENSKEDTINEHSEERAPVCGACASLIKTKSQLHKTNCGHTFHKSCLTKCEKIRPYCPLCNTRLYSEPPTPSSSGACTRSQARSASVQPAGNQPIEEQSSSASTMPTNAGVVDSGASIRPGDLQHMISSIVSAQQAQLLSSISNQVSRLVQSNIESQLSRLNLNGQSAPAPAMPTANQHPSPRQIQTAAAVEERTFREMFGISPNNSQNHGHLDNSRLGPTGSQQSSSSDLASRPDKVLHIISNWRIKFTGNSCGLSVKNFFIESNPSR